MSPISPEHDPSSLSYNPTPNSRSPIYATQIPEQDACTQDYNDESQDTVATDAVHIPTWVAPFVLGGCGNRRLRDITRRSGGIVNFNDNISFDTANRGPYLIVVLWASGKESIVIESMRSVKNELVSLIAKAEKMKKNGTWENLRRSDE